LSISDKPHLRLWMGSGENLQVLAPCSVHIIVGMWRTGRCIFKVMSMVKGYEER
jgi:hypothetical protein